MTQSIRDAAQSLLNSVREHLDDPERMEYTLPYKALEDLHAALSVPQPTADERVADHMRCVDDFARASTGQFAQSAKATRETIEASARALLSASQEDAEHAAMYRWLRSKSWASEAHDYGCTDYRFPLLTRTNYDGSINHATVDAAIRAAMSAKETK